VTTVRGRGLEVARLETLARVLGAPHEHVDFLLGLPQGRG